MSESEAKALAKLLRGEQWQSGGGIWLATIQRQDGKIIVLSDDVVRLFDDEDALSKDRARASITFH
jgi:hypothetical protein